MSKNTGIIGKWFHSFTPEGILEWQGKVVAKPTVDKYLVQTFSWLDGGEMEQVLVDINHMMNWKFYTDSKEMREAYLQRRFNENTNSSK